MKASERAAVLRRIADAIRDHAQEFIEREVADIGMPIAQMKGLAARAAENFDYYARCDRRAARPVVPGRRRVPQLHDPQAGRRCRADHAVERAADALDVADRARARRRQHRGAQAGGVVAADRDLPRVACSRRPELPTGVFNVVHGFGETAGAALSRHPGVAADLLHRRDHDRAARSSPRARRRSSAPRSSSAASRRWSCSRTPIRSCALTRRSPRSSR